MKMENCHVRGIRVCATHSEVRKEHKTGGCYGVDRVEDRRSQAILVRYFFFAKRGNGPNR
jgi:hypothetical protein